MQKLKFVDDWIVVCIVNLDNLKVVGCSSYVTMSE